MRIRSVANGSKSTVRFNRLLPRTPASVRHSEPVQPCTSKSTMVDSTGARKSSFGEYTTTRLTLRVPFKASCTQSRQGAMTPVLAPGVALVAEVLASGSGASAIDATGVVESNLVNAFAIDQKIGPSLDFVNVICVVPALPAAS